MTDDSQPKVCNFDNRVVVRLEHQNVVRLLIAMPAIMLVVHVVYALEDGKHYLAHLPFLEVFLFFFARLDIIAQGTTVHHFHYLDVYSIDFCHLFFGLAGEGNLGLPREV